MAISPLPPAPSTSDPANFASKGDALLSALPTLVTEANALQADVNDKQVTASAAAVDAVNAKVAAESFSNATKWVSGTTYGDGDVAWSPVNFKSYRRKIAGAGTTDPSLDTTNWSALAGGTMTDDIVMSGASIIETEGADVASATTTDIWATDGNTRHITGNVTITSFGTAPQAGARMKLIFDGTPELVQSANLNLNAGGSNIIIEAGDWAEVYADTTTQFDVVVHRKSGAAVVAPVIPTVSGTLIGYQIFTASGTYTKVTNNPSFVIVEVVGGGGGGGGGGSVGINGTGGGSGAFSRKKILDASLSSSETVTIGAGGSGGAAGATGSTGGTSSFGAHCSCTGGTGGTNDTTGGAGGTATGGDYNIKGGGASTGSGAASIFGGAGRAIAASTGGAGAPNTGGGGSGGSGAGTSGGAGGSGVVIVWEYA